MNYQKRKNSILLSFVFLTGITPMIKIRVIGTQQEVASVLNFVRTSQEFKSRFNLADFSQPYQSRKRDDEYLLYLSLIEHQNNGRN